MDVLLSLPIASYFFSSSLTSWSTSLNLLFFYMTWSTLVLSHSPLKIELIGVTTVRIVLWLIPSLFFLLFDTALPSLAESIKYNGASAIPPREFGALSRLLALALINLLTETVVEGGLSLGLTTLLKSPIFRTTTTLPLPWQMCKHIAILFAARELLTYAIHRNVLHSNAHAGRYISPLHQRFAHMRNAPPFSLLLFADHPLPFLLHRFLPLYLPAVLLHRNNLHLLTYFLFAGLCTIEETLAMSGYTIVPGIVMGGIVRRNAIHYSKPVGNFGCWGLLDWIQGTSLGKDVMTDVRDEVEKHQVKERSAKTASDVGDLVQERLDGLRRSTRSRGRKGKKGSSNE